MRIEDLLYSLGESAESLAIAVKRFLKMLLKPEPSGNPPKFRIISRLLKRGMTIHELISLNLQLTFLMYLFISFGVAIFTKRTLYIVLISIPYFTYLRYFLCRYGRFMIDVRPYRFFYYGVSVISFFAFSGYMLIREFLPKPYYYVYLVIVVFSVLAFWWYFKHRFKRDYTYGVVEEVKNDLVRVFVHDDIAANVKPGRYWVPKVEEAEPDRVVKLLVEERFIRGAVPVRILEVYMSSKTETEPKDTEE